MRILNRFPIKFVPQKIYPVLTVSCFLLVIYSLIVKTDSKINDKIMEIKSPQSEVQRYFEKRQDWETSNLGSMLFKITPIEDSERASRTYTILIWKYWKWLENRHVYNYNRKRNPDPLEGCSVKNCVFTGNDNDLNSADAVVVHIQRGVYPNVTERNRKQRWIFLSDESPRHSFSMSTRNVKFTELANIFNWSMTYRSDSDVPVPYGRTIPLETPLLSHVSYESLGKLVPFWEEKRRDVLVTILISNCGVSRRMNYLKELEKYIAVDVYGKCSKDHKDSCPGHFRSDCKATNEYLFYLVFENSECHEYLTEKAFYNAYGKGAIPIIMGPTVSNCEMLLPPQSFLHVDNYKNAEDLANHIQYLSKDNKNLLEYHRWRNDYGVVSENGYFGSKSVHYCRVCEALNFNDGAEKIYDEERIKHFLDPSISCR